MYTNMNNISTNIHSISTRRAPSFPDATTKSPQLINLPTGGSITTDFVFQTKDSQNAANSVYEYASTFNANRAANGSQATYNFKSDYERMQYLQGRFARARGTSGY
jgi:hypothetical protein